MTTHDTALLCTYMYKRTISTRNEAWQNEKNSETRSGKKIRLATARSPLLRGLLGMREDPRDGHSPSYLAEIGRGPATISDETRWMRGSVTLKYETEVSYSSPGSSCPLL